MSGYAVAHLDEIDEISDGRCPSWPVRHHFGITSFGVNAWTGRETGDRIINEHDEADDAEELYLVQQGRARFELDGERVDRPAGTLVFARPGVKRTAFAEEPETTIRLERRRRRDTEVQRKVFQLVDEQPHLRRVNYEPRFEILCPV